MRQPSLRNGSSEVTNASGRDSWISTGVAIFAIAAAAVLCFESFAEADKSMERVHVPSARATQTSAGNR